MKSRFFSKTKLAEAPRPGITTPCLEWTAGRNQRGYGRFKRAGKTELAHRVAWELANGPVPTGMCVLHRCSSPCCVAVEHLFLGTQADNNADMVAKGRQVTPRGDAHLTRLHPERLARGDANGARLHPESRPRGDRNGRAKLNEVDVRRIFELRDQGWTGKCLAAEFGVDQAQISRILARKRWARVELA